MKNKTVLGILFTAVLITALFLLTSKPYVLIKPTDYRYRIDSLKVLADSLEKVLESRTGGDTIYKTKIRVVTKYIEEQTDSIKEVPLEGKSSYFSRKTGADSLHITEDSITLVPPEQIWKADSIFIRQEGQELIIKAQSEAMASKDTTLLIQKKRLAVLDDFSYTLSDELQKQTIETKRQKRLKELYKIATILFVAVSMFK